MADRHTNSRPRFWRAEHLLREAEQEFSEEHRQHLVDQMTEQPVKEVYELTNKELKERLRLYPTGIDPRYGPNLGAENERRQGLKNRRYTLFAIIFAATSAFGSMIAAFASWYMIYLNVGH